MIFIKPYYHIDRLNSIERCEVNSNFIWGKNDYLFFENGKNAIHFLINKLGLTREDEVCIFTTTNSNYVSTCVSATFFNYCKISRVITDKTKLLYVIHEFGFPYEEINQLVSAAQKLKIPLVEDCAHTMDSHLDGKRVGTFGQYAIYSVSKHLPIENCGLLTGDDLKNNLNEYYNSSVGVFKEKEYIKYLPYLPSLSKNKIANAKRLVNQLSESGLTSVLKIEEKNTPHLVVFESLTFMDLYSLTKEIIEAHPLHVKNWFAISVQPLMTDEEIDNITSQIKKILL